MLCVSLRLYGADENFSAEEFRERIPEEKRQFRSIVSPQDGAQVDLTEFARQLMRQVEKDMGRRLIWAAVNHHNTDNPHVHDPALSCLTVSTTPGTCDCDVELTVTNDCTDAITTSDFVFRGCKLPGQDQFTSDCALLEPRGTGYLELDIDGTGMKSWDLHLQQAETLFTLSVRANVTAFDAHPGCDCATSGRAQDFGSTAVALGLLAWLARRRRPRTSDPIGNRSGSKRHQRPLGDGCSDGGQRSGAAGSDHGV